MAGDAAGAGTVIITVGAASAGAGTSTVATGASTVEVSAAATAAHDISTAMVPHRAARQTTTHPLAIDCMATPYW
jgi:hypothetical protein